MRVEGCGPRGAGRAEHGTGCEPPYGTSDTDGDDVSVVDTRRVEVVDTEPVGDEPKGIAVTPDGSRVHVTDFADDEVSVIGAHSDRVVDRIEVGDGPTGVATPGRRAGPTGGARRPPPHARDEPARALSSPVTAEAYGPDGPRSPAPSRVVDWDHDDG
ncbi:YncE family protein [Streptomyces sp. NPDC019539]|uniref:YncE family protein n=1 Tax=Streptomyces sp. NPDC019539 TaxID=3365063 RepID=UPI0037B80BB4